MDLLTDYEAQDQWRNWDAMLERLPIVPGQTILDLGCGPGLISKRLATRGANVIGIDQNAELVSAARQRCPASCEFLQMDLIRLGTGSIPQVDGLWSSFTAAYFPDFAPVLRRCVSCLASGGWVALVEIDDLWSGHHPLPADVSAALKEYTEHMRAAGKYDSCMGRRLGSICRNIGLTTISESRWDDSELAFDGPASAAILAAWQRRFARSPAMKTYFGVDRFSKITKAFLDAIASTDHRSTASVVMIQAERCL